jgi:hypothetical protein
MDSCVHPRELPSLHRAHHVADIYKFYILLCWAATIPPVPEPSTLVLAVL